MIDIGILKNYCSINGNNTSNNNIFTIPEYNFDYSQVITKDNMNLEVYNKKFELWDLALKNGIDNHNIKLLNDPTIYMYALFGIRHRWYQDMFISDNYPYKIFEGANQVVGKEQPYSSKVLTLNGYVSMGSLNIGDTIIGSDGKPCKVLQIYEQGKKDIYKITFTDGSQARCGLDHLWKIMKPTHKKKLSSGYKENMYEHWSVMTLRDILSQWGDKPEYWNKISIPLVEPVQFSEKEQPIHPYNVGVMLGDGTMSANYCRQITCHPDDIEIIERFYNNLPDGLEMKQGNFDRYWYINSNLKHTWSKLFKQSKLKHWKTYEKEIPKNYLLGSVDQRIELLRGLMDSDGSAYKTGVCEFSSKSKRLIEDLQFIVHSLGGKCNIIERNTGYCKKGKYIDCGIGYRCVVRLENINPFYLTRKAKRALTSQRCLRKERSLKKIEKVHEELSRCILVDSYDNTYITDDCIVTHNSYMLNTSAIYTFLKDHGYSHIRAIISATIDQASFQLWRIKNILNQSGILNWRDEKGDKENVSIISLNHYHAKEGKYKNTKPEDRVKYTNLILVAPCSVGSLGYPVNVLDLDEIDFWEKVNPKHAFNQWLQPRTYETMKLGRAQINLYSNPNGMEGFMYELRNQLYPDGRRKWHVYNFNYWDSPGANQKDFETKCIGLSRREIESTLLSIYTSAQGSYFDYKDIIESEDKSLNMYSGMNKVTVGFLDPGSSVDHSVFVMGYTKEDEDKNLHFYAFIIHEYPLGYPMYRVVGVYNPNQDNDGWHYEKSVSEYLKEHTVGGYNPIFDCDVSKNDSLTALFQTVGIFPQEIIKFSGPKKYNYYENLNYMIQRRPILFHRISNARFVEQMSNIEIKGKSSGNYLMLHASKDSIHDDICDSIVACCYLATNAQIHPGLTVIDSKGNSVNTGSDTLVEDVKKIENNNKSDIYSKVMGTKIGNVIETRDDYFNKQGRFKKRW